MTQNNEQTKHIMVYLDESGHIHKNSKSRYFAIGGFCCWMDDNLKIKSLYKRANKKIKAKYNISLDTELKARDMEETQKIELFSALKGCDGFCAVGIVFDKQEMHLQIESENLFYNYGVEALFEHVIFPLIDETNAEYVFHVVCDHRSMKSDDLKDLEKYLSTAFVVKNCSFKVEYRDSAHDYSIQIADLVVNTFYLSQEYPKIVENVLQSLEHNQYSIVVYPTGKREGRTEKLFYV